MAVSFVIHHATKNALAFAIDFSNYFLRIFPVPQLFNEALVPQIIPNLDNWFQARTHQRYSYRNVLDMMDAYLVGLSHTYSLTELEALTRHTIITTKNYLLTEKMGEYSKLFWIETLNPAKIDAHIDSIRENFEHLATTLSKAEFHNNLCRLRMFVFHNRPGLVPIIERLIERLGGVPSTPVYPVSERLDKELQKTVVASVLANAACYKNVAVGINEKLEALSR
jgi:hypothetical protein